MSRSFLDGDGDFAATAYWEPVAPEPGHHFHFSVYTSGEDTSVNETFGLGFQNLPTGFGIEQHLTNLNLSAGTYENFMSDFVPVTPAEVTGQIGFRYRDPNGLRRGIFRAAVRRNRSGRVSIEIAGRGGKLGMRTLPAMLPVAVRLPASTGTCWDGVLAPGDVRANTASRLHAFVRAPR